MAGVLKDRRERRSPESLAAREVAVLKVQGDEHEAQVASQPGSKIKRRRAERALARVRARERQLLDMLGATKRDS